MMLDRNSSGWRRRLALFTSVVGNQGICQLLTGLTGFLLVRVLPKEQYAWFTITSTLQAVLSALSDGGVATALMSIGGKVWQDQTRLSAVVGASLEMMTKLALFGTLLVLPIMIWLLNEQGAPWPIVAVLSLLSICPQWIMTRTLMLGIVNRLRSRVWALQAAELTLAGGRFVLTVIPWMLGLVHVVWASVAVAVAVAVQGIMVRRQVWSDINRHPDPQVVAEYRPQVKATVQQMLPSAAFNCFQGQLGVWLLGALGTTSQVADLGALNRLSFITNLAMAPMAFLVAPAFARCHDMARLRRMFLGVFAGYGLFFLALLLVALLQAPIVLWLLGGKYAHLEKELVLVIVGQVFSGFNSICWALNLAKGWVKHLWLIIPLSIITQTGAILLLDLRSVGGAAWLGIVLFSGYLAHSLTLSIQNLRRNEALD